MTASPTQFGRNTARFMERFQFLECGGSTPLWISANQSKAVSSHRTPKGDSRRPSGSSEQFQDIRGRVSLAERRQMDPAAVGLDEIGPDHLVAMIVRTLDQHIGPQE